MCFTAEGALSVIRAHVFFCLLSVFVTAAGAVHGSSDVASLQRACAQAGDVDACLEVANMHWSGAVTGWIDGRKATEAFSRAVSLSPARVLATSQGACAQGVAIGCNNLGYMYALGEGVRRDSKLAVQSFLKACDAGHAIACFNLGTLYEGRTSGSSRAAATGWKPPEPRASAITLDVTKAAALYQRACDGGAARGCLNLVGLHMLGRGVPRNEMRARALAQRACEGKAAGGCHKLGFFYRDGYGGPQDLGRAAQFFQQACDGGEALGCYDLGVQFHEGRGVPADDKMAADMYSKACELGEPRGCFNLAVCYRRGLGVLKNEAKADQLAGQACAQGLERACNALGR